MPRAPRRPRSPIPDPTTPTGSPLDHHGRDGLARGHVAQVDAQGHAYTVVLNDGRRQTMARLKTHPGDHTLYAVGTPVVVTHALGQPYIVGALPFEVAAGSGTAPGVTDTAGHGGRDPVLDQNLGINARAPDEPDDLLPGDFVARSADGAVVAALHGRVARVGASALAMVTAFGETDHVHVAAGSYRLTTWMGEAEYRNDGGRTSFVWRGGSDQLTETGPGAGRFPIALDVGATGDVVRFELANPQGQVLFRLHVDPEGRAEIFAAGGLDLHGGDGSDRTNATRHHGDLATEVEGGVNHRVARAATERFEAERTTSVTGTWTEVAGGDRVSTVNRDTRVEVAGTSEEVYGGRRAIGVGADHLLLVTGGHTARTALDGGGAIELDARPGDGTIRLQVAGDDKVLVGREGRSHLVMYEEFEARWTDLYRQLNDLRRALALHVHDGPVAASLSDLTLPLTNAIDAARTRALKGD